MGKVINLKGRTRAGRKPTGPWSIIGLAAVFIVLAFASAVSFFNNSTGAGAAARSVQFPICVGRVRITCIVDGDTLWLDGIKYRLMGIDTPELDREHQCGGYKEFHLATTARSRLQMILSSNEFTITTHGKDKYGRTLALFHIGGTTAGEMLVNEGLARSWPNGREFWCD